MKKYLLILIVSMAVIAVGYLGISFMLRPATDVSKSDELLSVANSQSNIILQNKYAKISGDAFDEQYVAGMFAHHEGAVNMAEKAMAFSGKKEIKDLAGDIVQSQSREMADLLQWQDEWGYKRTYNQGHNGHSGGGAAMAETMVGMQNSLEGKKGVEFDKIFLDQMIVHHSQAIAMSRPAATNAKHQEIKDLARNVIDAQEAEIAKMKSWQDEWGY
jgi:uncharacterized protein (DUF305 family)